jgi:hypothetical protein
MSDLAPFVAATLRDKVIKDLMDENQAMRKQLQLARRVEITGPGGTPVHAQAQFDDDGSYAGNPDLWAVNFPEGKQMLPCPLAALEGIEIRVGGILKAKFASNADFHTFIDAHSRDHEMGKVVAFCFGGASSLWFNILIDGWPGDQWRETITAAAAIDEDDLFRHLIRNVAAEAPQGKKVTFLGVEFMNEGVSGAIQALNLDRETQEDAEESRKRQAFIILIMKRMRSAGNEQEGEEVVAHASAIQVAFYRLGIYDDGEMFEQNIGPLIESQNRQAFLILIMRRMRSAGNEEEATEIIAHATAIQNAFNRLGVYDKGGMFEQIIGHLIESQNLSPAPEDFEAIVNNLVSITNGTYQEDIDEEEEEAE